MKTKLIIGTFLLAGAFVAPAFARIWIPIFQQKCELTVVGDDLDCLGVSGSCTCIVAINIPGPDD